MRPVLALELSSDGISLHELSYDSKWRMISYAALDDPFLPKKMSAMRATARASQGRFFKSQLWLPADQVKTVEIKVSAEDPEERQQEAYATLGEMPEYADGDYTLQVGENDSFGNATVALVDNSVLAEAKRFARGYGFGTEDVTSSKRINGFYQQPFFESPSTAPVKIPLAIDFRKIGFFAGVVALVAGLGAGGYWLYSTIDFGGDPSKAIEATENRVLDSEEDPRAPIRPTTLSEVATSEGPETIDGGTSLAPVPQVERETTAFDTQVGQTDLTSDLTTSTTPEQPGTQDGPALDQGVPQTLASSGPDSLPAPETTGIPLEATPLAQPVATAETSNFSGTGLAPVASTREAGEFAITPRRIDVLPRDESTVVLAGQLEKFNDSLGLTQVRANNAAALRLAQALEAQKIPPKIILGRPDVLPVLRGGVAVPDPLPEPVAPVAAEMPAATPGPADIATLQMQPPTVIEGLPELAPILRNGTPVTELPAEVAPVAAETPVAESDTPTDTVAPEAEQTAETAQAPVEPRPIPRPDSIAIAAVLNDPTLSEGAVPAANVPLHRSEGFAARAQAMIQKIEETARTTPRFTDTPREINLPTNANVAREATIENGILLNEMSLVGVYGKPGDYRALIRRKGGKYTMVKVGDVIDRWKVVAISENTVRIQKGSKTVTLKLPG